MTPFFTLFVLLCASDKHYFSKYWGGGKIRKQGYLIWQHKKLATKMNC